MHFFGQAIERVEATDAGEAKRRGPQNLLDLLPDTFTRDEAMQMRIRQGVVNGNLGNMLSTWKSRGYIEPVGEPTAPDGVKRFAKTRKYLNGRGRDR